MLNPSIVNWQQTSVSEPHQDHIHTLAPFSVHNRLKNSISILKPPCSNSSCFVGICDFDRVTSCSQFRMFRRTCRRQNYQYSEYCFNTWKPFTIIEKPFIANLRRNQFDVLTTNMVVCNLSLYVPRSYNLEKQSYRFTQACLSVLIDTYVCVEGRVSTKKDKITTFPQIIDHLKQHERFNRTMLNCKSPNAVTNIVLDYLFPAPHKACATLCIVRPPLHLNIEKLLNYVYDLSHTDHTAPGMFDIKEYTLCILSRCYLTILPLFGEKDAHNQRQEYLENFKDVVKTYYRWEEMVHKKVSKFVALKKKEHMKKMFALAMRSAKANQIAFDSCSKRAVGSKQSASKRRRILTETTSLKLTAAYPPV